MTTQNKPSDNKKPGQTGQSNQSSFDKGNQSHDQNRGMQPDAGTKGTNKPSQGSNKAR